jgi:phage shock protein A
MNKIANFFWTADPIAQLQYEYDKAVDQMKDGREGLEKYRALVERVNRQVEANNSHVAKLEAQVKAYLKAGERETASKFALELQKAKKELAENEAQLKLHETAYGNNVTKIEHAVKKLEELKRKIQKYDAELKMSRAEAELAKLATQFNFDVTTDFGQIEDVIHDKIDLNRAKVRVAADLGQVHGVVIDGEDHATIAADAISDGVERRVVAVAGAAGAAPLAVLGPAVAVTARVAAHDCTSAFSASCSAVWRSPSTRMAAL